MFHAAASSSAASAVESIEISDKGSSSSDDESEEEENKGKPIPAWAGKAALEQAQLRQTHIDPDTIFGVCRTTCNLADIFGEKKPRWTKRTSTGNWLQDQVTMNEEKRYKEQMGQIRAAADLR